MRVEIHKSARRHDIDDLDMLHAVTNSIAVDDLGEDPDRWLVVGPNRAGHLLEIVVLVTKRGNSDDHSRNATSTHLPQAARTMTNPIHGHTKSGTPITDALIDQYAKQAEQGFDIEPIVARRGRRGRPRLGDEPSTVESVRLDPELKDLLTRRADAEGVPVSEVIRDALRHHLKAS